MHVVFLQTWCGWLCWGPNFVPISLLFAAAVLAFAHCSVIPSRSTPNTRLCMPARVEKHRFEPLSFCNARARSPPAHWLRGRAGTRQSGSSSSGHAPTAATAGSSGRPVERHQRVEEHSGKAWGFSMKRVAFGSACMHHRSSAMTACSQHGDACMHGPLITVARPSWHQSACRPFAPHASCPWGRPWPP